MQLPIMIGAYTIGKKAATFGYKRYGIPGAVASGGAALAGYLIVRRALKSSVNSGNAGEAIDTGELTSAVDEQGMSAVTDKTTLEQVIDEDELGSTIDMDAVQSAAEDEADEGSETAEDGNSSAEGS